MTDNPTTCPVCGTPVDIAEVDVSIGGLLLRVPGKWSCPNGCDPRQPTRQDSNHNTL